MNETILINISKSELETLIKNSISETTKEIVNQFNQINQKSKTKEENRELIKEKDLAKMLGLNKTTFYHWRKQGKIKFIKIGRLIYYDKKELINLISEVQ